MTLKDHEVEESIIIIDDPYNHVFWVNFTP